MSTNNDEKKQPLQAKPEQSENEKNFPMITAILKNQSLTDKVKAIGAKEYKKQGKGILRIHYTDEKKDNCKLVYINQKTLEEKLEKDHNLVKAFKQINDFDKSLYILNCEKDKQIVMKLAY